MCGEYLMYMWLVFPSILFMFLVFREINLEWNSILLIHYTSASISDLTI